MTSPSWNRQTHRVLIRALSVIALLFTGPSTHPNLAPSTAGSDAKLRDPGSRLFRGFIENQGQWNTDALFIADFGDLLVRAEPGVIVAQAASAPRDPRQLAVVRLVFEGAATVKPRGVNRVPGEHHYVRGADVAGWRRHVPSYGDVVYAGIYPGTDLRLYERDGRCEYDVLLSPSANLDDFVVGCDGVDELSLGKNGTLRMNTPLGVLEQPAPTAWQVTASGKTIPTTCGFRMVDERRFGLQVSGRVPGASLVIDPGLTWSAFLGGSGMDWARCVRVRRDGTVLVLGRTASSDFPTTAGVFDTTVASEDLSLTCIDPSGSRLIFSTVLGGSDWEWPDALAVADDGRIAIGGWSKSADYPLLSASYDSTFNGGAQDACVSVLTPDGSGLVFSTLLGGAATDEVTGMAFSSTGMIVVAGQTYSPEFPSTPGAMDSSWGGNQDGFVACFDPALSGLAQLVWCSFLGSTSTDMIHALVLGPGDEPIVVGQTQSPDFPATPGAYDETQSAFMGFMTRFAADGSSLVASTHFQNGVPNDVVSDGVAIVVAGYSSGFEFPASANAFDKTANGLQDCFVARFDGQLSQLLAATLLGGSKYDSASALTMDQDGNIILAGATSSSNYPTSPGAFDTEFGGTSPQTTSVVSSLSGDLSQLLYSSFLGTPGAVASFANGVAAVGVADVVIVGQGAGSSFPVTSGGFDDTYNGGGDGYVVRMLLKSTWKLLGGAITGSMGTPLLSGSGDLVGGQPVTLVLSRAKPNAPATLVLGLALMGMPFKGGTLVPAPDILIAGLPTGPTGSVVMTAPWPPGVPSGFTTYFQYWIPDPAGPKGFAASNGLSGTTP